MAELIISPKQRWLPMPHIIKINHRVLGVVKGRDVRVQMPAGTYTIGVQSGLRFIESEVQTHIYEQAENRLVFSDRERWWNLLFNIDLVLWLVKRFVNLGEPWNTVYEVVSNGFFAVWMLRVWMIRKRYFKLEITQKFGTDSVK